MRFADSRRRSRLLMGPLRRFSVKTVIAEAKYEEDHRRTFSATLDDLQHWPFSGDFLSRTALDLTFACYPRDCSLA